MAHSRLGTDITGGGDIDALRLHEGSHVAVIGSGPAGSLFSYFLLSMAARVGLKPVVDIYEPRNFTRPGPPGCNMCGGIVSETLVRNLTTEGIRLPASVAQRGIDSYVLHMDVGSVMIHTPRKDTRITAVHRGAGPADLTKSAWESLDNSLMKLAVSRGARRIDDRVVAVSRQPDGVRLTSRNGLERTYDLVVVATGVNSSLLKAFEGLGIGYRRPRVSKALIREYFLGDRAISEKIGSSMHIFLLDLPRLKFAALVPKGQYVTMCLIGNNVDDALMNDVVSSPEVTACMPAGWQSAVRSCQCKPYLNISGATKPFADRILFVGDSGVTRLYKDGIGAAYRCAKAAARVAVFEGISAAAFRRHYLPTCRQIANDNRIGLLAFTFTSLIQRVRWLRRAVLRMTVEEQALQGRTPRLSGALWDMFTGSAPYIDIFTRMIHPVFIGRFLWSLAVSLLPVRHTERRSWRNHDHGRAGARRWRRRDHRPRRQDRRPQRPAA